MYHHHHHQPINVPTAGAQAFLMDYPQGPITHHAGPVRIGVSNDPLEELDGPAVSALAVRSQKLSNIGRSSDG
jgi:hypothetical protein